jgi:hypothetical protein
MEQGIVLPLFSIGDRSMAPGILDISKDGAKILYGENTKENVSVFNSHDSSTQALNLPRSPWNWWYQGDTKVLSMQPAKKLSSFDLVIYDLETGVIKKIPEATFAIDNWRSDAILLSPDQKFLSYASEKSGTLMIFPLCDLAD